jgi:NAD-dependent SIR2 family protein deacetylase
MKRCTKCEEEKPPAEFRRDRSQKDGRYPKCKACERRWRQENAEHLAEYHRRWQQANRDKTRAQDRRYRERKRQDRDYWERRRARDRVYRARKRPDSPIRPPRQPTAEPGPPPF